MFCWPGGGLPSRTQELLLFALYLFVGFSFLLCHALFACSHLTSWIFSVYKVVTKAKRKNTHERDQQEGGEEGWVLGMDVFVQCGWYSLIKAGDIISSRRFYSHSACHFIVPGFRLSVSSVISYFSLPLKVFPRRFCLLGL